MFLTQCFLDLLFCCKRKQCYIYKKLYSTVFSPFHEKRNKASLWIDRDRCVTTSLQISVRMSLPNTIVLLLWLYKSEFSRWSFCLTFSWRRNVSAAKKVIKILCIQLASEKPQFILEKNKAKKSHFLPDIEPVYMSEKN